MSDLSIKIDRVVKEYRLGAIGGATLKGDLQSLTARIRHKEDPNLKIGAEVYKKNEKFTALNDISFDVEQGEAIGIIGHNGAGKSTLLKLISRVTAPTKGSIYLNGRVASMLEVGTGFHPELTGRENVYLNGAILGMKKQEIDRKFDEIVEFSEVSRFIDTPVKRYSSGMYVKLAFSVAAHLDSEIMIMDEVLAVGDVAFQNKCIEQMKNVRRQEGRTILYVSHNMTTVRNLCSRCIVLDKGEKVYEGETETAISYYMKNTFSNDLVYDSSMDKRGSMCDLSAKILSSAITNHTTNIYEYGENVNIDITWQSRRLHNRVLLKMVIDTKGSVAVGVAYVGTLKEKNGINKTSLQLDTRFLMPGKYTLHLKLYDEDEQGNVVFYDQCKGTDFEVVNSEGSVHLKNWFPDWGNAVLPCVTKK